LEQKVIIIVGPTCSGKTSLSLNLAEKLNTEIISADSRQIYKELNIGTAKPTKIELQSIPHHLIDFLNPTENYSASKFEKDSIEIIKQIHAKNKIPIVVGGSGLYIKALVDGIFDSVDNDENFRNEILLKREEFGNKYLFNELEKVDPESASSLLPQNWKRIIRALEVFHITGEPIWKHQKDYVRDVNFNFLQFGINWERKILYENIEARVDEMIEKGLVDEIKSLLIKGYSRELNALNTVGYKELIDFFDDNISFERAIELIKRNTRRYAKRQMTWFRKDDGIKWFDVTKRDEINLIVESITSHLVK
jgi:tRNA dimethylallyltransferase